MDGAKGEGVKYVYVAIYVSDYSGKRKKWECIHRIILLVSVQTIIKHTVPIPEVREMKKDLFLK